MTQITVFGAGSIGCYLGGRLIHGGAKVRLIGRARYASAIAEHGLSLSQYEEPVFRTDAVDFQTDPATLVRSDIVALCVKSQDTEEAAHMVAQYAPNAWIISFQNGVANLPVLKKTLPEATISGAVVPFNVTSPKSGHFHRGTDGDVIIGPRAPEALIKPLQNAQVGVQSVDNIDGYLWAKLLVNLNNALNTLSGGPLRAGLIQKDYRRVLIAMIREGLSVAQAEGVDVATFNNRHPQAFLTIMSRPDWLYRLIMDRIVKIDRTARSSMLDDLDLGRASELDYLQGEIVRRADQVGLAVPVNRAVKAAVEQAFEQKKSPRMSGADMATTFLD